MTLLVFNTQIMIISFVIIMLQLFLLPTIYITVLTNKKDKSRLRFFILTLGFLSFNFFGSYFPDINSKVPILIQNCFIYGSGIFMAGYFFVFIAKEFNFKFNSLFSIKFLFISLFASFILGYGIIYYFTQNFNYAYYTFITCVIIISVFFCTYSLREFILSYKLNNNEDLSQLIFYSCFIGIVLIALLPFVSVLSGNQAAEVLLVNTAYFLLAFAFIKNYIEVHSITNLQQNGSLLEENCTENCFDCLTTKELEIAHLILQDKKQKEIGEKLNITSNTVGKHASNIYKKVNTSNKIEFIEKYLPIFKNKIKTKN